MIIEYRNLMFKARATVSLIFYLPKAYFTPESDIRSINQGTSYCIGFTYYSMLSFVPSIGDQEAVLNLLIKKEMKSQ